MESIDVKRLGCSRPIPTDGNDAGPLRRRPRSESASSTADASAHPPSTTSAATTPAAGTSRGNDSWGALGDELRSVVILARRGRNGHCTLGDRATIGFCRGHGGGTLGDGPMVTLGFGERCGGLSACGTALSHGLGDCAPGGG